MAIDRESPTWRAVKAAVEASLATDRALLETPVGEALTNQLRGRIAALRSVLALAEDKPMIETSTALY